MFYFLLFIATGLGVLCSILASALIFVATESPVKRFWSYISVMLLLIGATWLSIGTSISMLVFGFSLTFLSYWCILRHDRMINSKMSEVNVE